MSVSSALGSLARAHASMNSVRVPARKSGPSAARATASPAPFDFATSQLPGWHTTIFPPYFVAGAIFSGFAMVVTLAVPARQLFGLKDLITLRHLDNMNKVILVTGCMVGYAYSMEFFIAWYSGALYEKFAFVNRAFGQ